MPPPEPLATISSPLMWVGFIVFMLCATALDLGLGKRRRGMSTKSALLWCGVWVTLALAFNGWIFVEFGRAPAEEFFAGYLLEKSLSVDNLFVFVLVFAYFRTPLPLQHRALAWGIIGAMILRAIMILAGAALINEFHWTLVIFGGFLVFTGVKLLFADDDDDISNSRLIKFLRDRLPLVEGYREGHFTVVEDGKRQFTYLFLTVLVIEFSDVIFAVDSVPAIFGVTTDPFIVFTSNMFAILGLRALFFAIASAIQKLKFLNYGLSIVLSFIGVKMILGFVHDVLVAKDIATVAGGIPVEWFKIETDTSLGLICAVLLGTAAVSILLAPREEAEGNGSGNGNGDGEGEGDGGGDEDAASEDDPARVSAPASDASAPASDPEEAEVPASAKEEAP